MHCIEETNTICINNGLTRHDDKKARCENRLSFLVAHSRIFANNGILLCISFLALYASGLFYFYMELSTSDFLSNKTIRECGYK